MKYSRPTTEDHMEFKLIPLSSELETRTVLIPKDILSNVHETFDHSTIATKKISKRHDGLLTYLAERYCSKAEDGKIQIEGIVLENTDFDQFISYLTTGKGKKPKTFRKIIKRLRIPKKYIAREISAALAI